MKIKIFEAACLPGSNLVIDSGVSEDAILYRGYLEASVFDVNEFFGICNWICYTDGSLKNKPECLHSEIEYCNHGIIFEHPDTGEWHLALSRGWKIGTKEEITQYVHDHWRDIVWD